MAKVDGTADETELELIRQIGSSNNISAEEIDAAIAEAEASDTIPGLDHLSVDDRFELLYNLVLVMKADGIIDVEEVKFCKAMVRKLGFRDDVLQDLIDHSPEEDPDGAHQQEINNRARKYFNG